MDTVSFFVFQKHSMFMPLRYFYPECIHLCDKHSDVHPLACFTHPSIVNSANVEPILRRSHYVFEQLWPALMRNVPSQKFLYVYYKHPNMPRSVQSGVFMSDLGEPKVIIFNKSAFAKFQKESVTYEWQPSMDFLLLGGDKNLKL